MRGDKVRQLAGISLLFKQTHVSQVSANGLSHERMPLRVPVNIDGKVKLLTSFGLCPQGLGKIEARIISPGCKTLAKARRVGRYCSREETRHIFAVVSSTPAPWMGQSG